MLLTRLSNPYLSRGVHTMLPAVPITHRPFFLAHFTLEKVAFVLLCSFQVLQLHHSADRSF